MKTRTHLKGQRVSRGLAEHREGSAWGKKKPMAPIGGGVLECKNFYEYCIYVPTYLLDLRAKTAKAACERGLCISEAAWKPQERASKAKFLIGTRVHAARQDSRTTTQMHTCTHARTSHAPGVGLGESPIIGSSHGSARMNIQPGKRGRKSRDERLTRRVTGEQNTDLSPFFFLPAHREDSETGTACDVGM